MKSIAVEGPDGIGKSKFTENLSKWIGWRSVKFPNYKTESGKQIEMMLNGEIAFDAEYFQWLQYTNKLETLAELGDGKFVFDRYKDSQKIYGRQNGVPEEMIKEYLDQLPEPDITIVLTGTPFRVDESIFGGLEYQKKIAEMYLQECTDPKKYIIINVDGKDPDDVLDNALFWLEARGII